ncbi:MAG TPA: hypothetical protein G4O07_00975 [Dehalococcoidia bacterium]|nr:hypothetical protein [Dehalococcoidia bacterium]
MIQIFRQSTTVDIYSQVIRDIPSDIVEALEIAIVPVYVRFGNTAYKDGVDISSDDYYTRLSISAVHI